MHQSCVSRSAREALADLKHLVQYASRRWMTSAGKNHDRCLPFVVVIGVRFAVIDCRRPRES